MKTMTGLDELNSLLDSITNPKFRARALRKSAKETMIPVKTTLDNNAPSMLKDKSIIRITVNTNKELKPSKRFLNDKKYNELYSEVTYKNEDYGMAMILENGRKQNMAEVSDGKKWHTYGKATDETSRDIGTTEGLHFVEQTRFECEDEMAIGFGNKLLAQVEAEIKKQDKRAKRKPK